MARARPTAIAAALPTAFGNRHAHRHARRGGHHHMLPGTPLNGPARSDVIQPP